MRGLARLGILAVSLQLVTIPSIAETSQPELPPKTDAGALQLGFIFSFYDDLCGDPKHGEIYRRAMREKLANCHLSRSKKDAIEQQMTAYEQNMKAELRDIVVRYGKLPDSLSDLDMSCADFFKSEQARLEQLDAYASGAAKVDDFIGQDACDPVEGGP